MRDELFNPLDPDVLRDPFPVYRRLRETDPVHWHEQLQSWVLTRYADCLAVLRNADRFANDFRRVGIPTPEPILNLQTLDPPEQTPLRNFAVAAMRAQDLGALEADAVHRADALLEPLAAGGPFDFVRDFSDPFTLGTISFLLGADPPQTDAAWDRMNDELDRSMDSGLDPDSLDAGLQARAEFSRLIGSWLEERPEKGILGYIVRNEQATGVSREILLNSCRAFWHAGFEVPSRFLCNAVLALLRSPDALAALAGRDSLDTAVEELVRFAGPVHVVSRAATEDTEIGGRAVRRGQIAIVVLAAANRDPEQFADPETLALDRDPNPHLGFGRGAHSCLGLNVARIETRVALASLVRHAPGLRLAGEPEPRDNATLRGPRTLPVSASGRLAAAGAAGR